MAGRRGRAVGQRADRLGPPALPRQPRPYGGLLLVPLRPSAWGCRCNSLQLRRESSGRVAAHVALPAWRSVEAHEPPILVRRIGTASSTSGRCARSSTTTEAAGAVFQHFAYATEDQVRFKESYYGYGGAVEGWRELRRRSGPAVGPYGSATTCRGCRTIRRRRRATTHSVIARERKTAAGRSAGGAVGLATASPVREGVIVVDGRVLPARPGTVVSPVSGV